MLEHFWSWLVTWGREWQRRRAETRCVKRLIRDLGGT